MMKLEFLPKALETYNQVKQSNPALAGKIKTLLKDTLSHPENGLGEPTPLVGKYQGIWQRKLSFEDAVFYAFNDEKVLVTSLSVKAFSPAANHGDFTLDSFTSDEYASVMAQMSANRGKAGEPQVGIFWYNRARNELFGVVSHRVSDYSKANASDGRITCSEMHEDVWKKEFRKQKYHGDGNGLYIGAYQDKPRGRIFYNIVSDTYEIAVGKWIEDYPQAYDLILDEFKLPKEKTEVKYAIHWDIGMCWR